MIKKILLIFLFTVFLNANEMTVFEKKLLEKKYNNKKIFSTRYSYVTKRLKVFWILNNIELDKHLIKKNDLNRILIKQNISICTNPILKTQFKKNNDILYVYFDKNKEIISRIVFNIKKCKNYKKIK